MQQVPFFDVGKTTKLPKVMSSTNLQFDVAELPSSYTLLYSQNHSTYYFFKMLQKFNANVTKVNQVSVM